MCRSRHQAWWDYKSEGCIRAWDGDSMDCKQEEVEVRIICSHTTMLAWWCVPNYKEVVAGVGTGLLAQETVQGSMEITGVSCLVYVQCFYVLAYQPTGGLRRT